MTPQRIQRRRVKGWRKPDGVIYVGRGTDYGNPFAWRTRAGLARVPALDGSPWEYESRISAHGMRHDYYHPYTADGKPGPVTVHHIRYMTRAECVELYRKALLTPTKHLHIWLGYDHKHRRDLGWLTPARVREDLAGKDLMCWCALDQSCHADVLLEIANGGAS